MKLVRSFMLCMAPLLFVSTLGWSQSTPAQAMANVTIHTADGKTIEEGTIVWRNGIIESIGDNAPIPFDAYVIDGGDSLHVYPGFIDGLALWGSPDLPESYGKPARPGEPGYERAGIQPQRQPYRLLNTDDESFTKAQKLGFTTAGLGLKGQMLPGQVDLFFINGEKTGENLVRESIGLSGSFQNAGGGFGSGAYPSTLMGVMARFRQLWYDATALKQQTQYFTSVASNYPAPQKDVVLQALYPVMEQQQPLFFAADAGENISRLLILRDDLNFNVILVSAREAFEKADELNKRGIPVLAGIDLPEEPEWRAKKDKAEQDTVETPDVEEEVTEEMRMFRERQLQAYLATVENIKRMIDSGVKVGYASNGLNLDDFKKHIQTLNEEGGLGESQILAMLTQHTADILGLGNKTGDLKEGRIASFTAFTKPFTEDESQAIYSVSNGMLTEFESETPDKE